MEDVDIQENKIRWATDAIYKRGVCNSSVEITKESCSNTTAENGFLYIFIQSIHIL
jgi:hypothetical protein